MSEVPPSDRRPAHRGADVVPPVGSAAVPQLGSGDRRARRRRRQQLGRRRALGTAAATCGVVGVLGVVATLGYQFLRPVDEGPPQAAAGTTVAPDGPGAAAATGPARALLVQEGDGGGVVGVTVLVVGPGGAGGHVVFAPVGSMVEVPSFGLSALREAYALGGLPLLRQSLENLLGIAFDHVALVAPADLRALVESAGVLPVELTSDVEVVTDVGRIETVFPAGTVNIPPAAAPALLEVRGSGSDLDRLVRHQAFWQAWLGALGDEPAAAPPAGAAEGVGAVVADLAAGTVGYELLPVEVVATGTGPDDDLYAIRAEALEALVAEVAPGSSAEVADRTRVQVLNGTGVPGLGQQVQPSLAAAGAVVSLTGNADRFDYDVTQVVYYRDEDLETARAVQRALGVGEVVRSLVELDVVDVTVVIGADFPAGSKTTSTTTTTSDPGP